MGKGQEKGYWDKRVLKDKARDVNNAEKFLQKNQKVLYAQAAKEIQQEIEKLYGKFTDQQDISIAEARRLIRGADFKKIDWQGMIRESMELREKIREGKGMLPEEVIEALEKQVAKNVITIHSIKEDVNVGNVAFRKGCKLTKCPVCGKFLSNDKYCRYCGQRLKWEV